MAGFFDDSCNSQSSGQAGGFYDDKCLTPTNCLPIGGFYWNSCLDADGNPCEPGPGPGPGEPCKVYECDALDTVAPELDMWYMDDPTYSSTATNLLRGRAGNTTENQWTNNIEGVSWSQISTLGTKDQASGGLDIDTCAESVLLQHKDNTQGFQWTGESMSPELDVPDSVSAFEQTHMCGFIRNVKDGLSTSIRNTSAQIRYRENSGAWDSYAEAFTLRIEEDNGSWALHMRGPSQMNFVFPFPAGSEPDTDKPVFIGISGYHRLRYNKVRDSNGVSLKARYEVHYEIDLSVRIDDYTFPRFFDDSEWSHYHHAEQIEWDEDNPDTGVDFASNLKQFYGFEWQGVMHHLFLGDETISDYWDEIWDAFQQNYADYVDPNPDCIGPPGECKVYECNAMELYAATIPDSYFWPLLEPNYKLGPFYGNDLIPAGSYPNSQYDEDHYEWDGPSGLGNQGWGVTENQTWQNASIVTVVNLTEDDIKPCYDNPVPQAMWFDDGAAQANCMFWYGRSNDTSGKFAPHSHNFAGIYSLWNQSSSTIAISAATQTITNQSGNRSSSSTSSEVTRFASDDTLRFYRSGTEIASVPLNGKGSGLDQVYIGIKASAGGVEYERNFANDYQGRASFDVFMNGSFSYNIDGQSPEFPIEVRIKVASTYGNSGSQYIDPPLLSPELENEYVIEERWYGFGYGYQHGVHSLSAFGSVTSNSLEGLYQAYLQNKESYVDPDPNCIPVVPVEEIYVAGQAWTGFGHDCMISDGVTTGGEWMINPDGQNFLYRTFDNGDTFEQFRIRTDIPTVNLRMLLGTDGVWVLDLYRDSNREPLPYFEDPDTQGVWRSFGHGNSSAYSHSLAIEGIGANMAAYYVDSNNNSGGSLHKLTDWYTDRNPTVEIGANTNAGSSSWWHTFVTPTHVFAARGGQGEFTVGDYGVWDKSNLNNVDYYPDSIYSGRTASSDGLVVKSAGSLFSGAISGSVVTVQTWGTQSVTSETFDFDVAVEDAAVHYADGWFVSAIDNSDDNKMFIGVGSSGNTYYEIDLPYPNGNYPYRTLRKIGANEYALAYLGVVGGTNNVFVCIKVTLD